MMKEELTVHGKGLALITDSILSPPTSDEMWKISPQNGLSFLNCRQTLGIYPLIYCSPLPDMESTIIT
jgi:hypothetical protein